MQRPGNSWSIRGVACFLQLSCGLSLSLSLSVEAWVRLLSLTNAANPASLEYSSVPYLAGPYLLGEHAGAWIGSGHSCGSIHASLGFRVSGLGFRG